MVNQKKHVRVSLGTAISLGLIDGWATVQPRTVYLLTYYDDKCLSNCGFCSLARNSKSRGDMLSRVIWPKFELEKVINEIYEAENKKRINRICIQAMNQKTLFNDILDIIKKIRLKSNLPISLSIQPIMRNQMERLGGIIDKLSIPIDAASEELFNKVKGKLVNGPYEWHKQINSLLNAIEFFGKGNVTTHLIVGLGETDYEMLKMIQWSIDNDIIPSLFAFTPIKGTALENLDPPPLPRYRTIQIANNILKKNITRIDYLNFDSKGRLCDFEINKALLSKIISEPSSFMTSGCPFCDRPYFNEKVTGPLYNYPYKPSNKEMISIKNQIQQYFPNNKKIFG
ncbi:MAG: radical SAM protein [Candidatus Bathyarchaeota archaeon]|nr:radical SAM protein [Candidatus Bathyarchaeota archaeon]